LKMVYLNQVLLILMLREIMNWLHHLALSSVWNNGVLKVEISIYLIGIMVNLYTSIWNGLE
jgi:hypothetical protein